MITKQCRNTDSPNLFNLEVTDKLNNMFIMTVGGNGDLYWLPKAREFPATYYIDISDKLMYNMLTDIFKNARLKDNKYNPSLINDAFTFISEDFHEDEANKLQIIKDKDCFKITFIKTEPIDSFSFKRYSRGCPICFCNSGSRVPEIEQLFMIAFIELAYHTPELQPKTDGLQK